MKGFHILIDPSKQGADFMKVSTIGYMTRAERLERLSDNYLLIKKHETGVFYVWDETLNEMIGPSYDYYGQAILAGEKILKQRGIID